MFCKLLFHFFPFKNLIEMAIQWLSRFTLSPSRSGYLSLAFLPAYRANAERLSEGLAAVGRRRGVVCPSRGSASSPRVIFHSCCANPSLVDATSTRSHSLGGRARHEFQCSDGQSVALFTSLSWKSWGIRGGRPPGTVGATQDYYSAALPLGPGHASQASFSHSQK